MPAVTASLLITPAAHAATPDRPTARVPGRPRTVGGSHSSACAPLTAHAAILLHPPCAPQVDHELSVPAVTAILLSVAAMCVATAADLLMSGGLTRVAHEALVAAGPLGTGARRGVRGIGAACSSAQAEVTWRLLASRGARCWPRLHCSMTIHALPPPLPTPRLQW